MAETETTNPWDVSARIERAFTDPANGWIAEADGELAAALAAAAQSLRTGYMVRQARLIRAKAHHALVENVGHRAERLGWLGALNDVRGDVEVALRSLDGISLSNAHDRAVAQERLEAYGRFLEQADALLAGMAKDVYAGIEKEVTQQATREDDSDGHFHWQQEADGLQACILGLIAAGAPGAAGLAELALRVDGDRMRHYCGGSM